MNNNASHQMQPDYQIVSGSVPGSQKRRNGDASTHLLLGSDPRYLVAMVADGVGSTSSDWIASSAACELFRAFPMGDDPAVWLCDTVQQIDEELHQRSQLFLCAAVAVVWEINMPMWVTLASTR
jgi:serine/threonine protein phosphatase PrpC